LGTRTRSGRRRLPESAHAPAAARLPVFSLTPYIRAA